MLSVRFEFPRGDKVSEYFGPYEWVQLTYKGLRVSPDGDHLAVYNTTGGYWSLLLDGSLWSDVIVFPAKEED